MSRCDLDLWPVVLESSCYIKRHVIKNVRNLSEIEPSAAEVLMMILRFFCTRYVAPWPWTFELELLPQFDCHAFKLCTKFERNRIIQGWVIDDLARFRRAIFLGGGWRGWGTTDRALLRVRGLNFTKLGDDIRRLAIIAALHFRFRVRISCCIFKRGRLKDEWCWKRRQISHFWPPVWPAVERGVLIKSKERKKVHG